MLIVVSLLAVSVASASVYTVRNQKDSGAGSLRRAIQRANQHLGPDRIKFAPRLAGTVILPMSRLPKLVDPGTTIVGDIDGDGAPDIAINGKRAGNGSGFKVEADECKIIGVAVTSFKFHGIHLNGASRCEIRGCHVGVNLAGTAAVLNGIQQIKLDHSDHNTIGGRGLAGRNIIAVGPDWWQSAGVHVYNSGSNHIRNSNFGIARDGNTPLVSTTWPAGAGVYLETEIPTAQPSDRARPAVPGTSEYNLIGGTDPGDRNVFGAMREAISMWDADRNRVQGNYVGLGRDGNTPVSLGRYLYGYEGIGVRVLHGSSANLIGGAAGGRNVIAQTDLGVQLSSEYTENNIVEGNYFGLNASGTAERRIGTGVYVGSFSGPEIIRDNTFAGSRLRPNQNRIGVDVVHGTGGTVITVRGNRFGVIPGSHTGDPGSLHCGVRAHWTVRVIGNAFYGTNTGVLCEDRSTRGSWIIGNHFRQCQVAVEIQHQACPLLGDMGNAKSRDDGGNIFEDSNTWYIRNKTRRDILAEGNLFPSSPPSPHIKIWDRQDDPTRGVVDIYPIGGIVLAAGAGAAPSLSALAAVPTGSGAQITFALSSPAAVEARVLNTAGRPVRTLCHAHECEAGVNALVWNGQSDRGLHVPSGTYLVRITARNGDGEQRAALCSVTLP